MKVRAAAAMDAIDDIDVLTGTELGKDLATLGTVTVSVEGNKIVVEGELEYITGWTAYSTIPGQSDGYFVAIDYTVNEDANIVLANGDRPEKEWDITGTSFQNILGLELDGEEIKPVTITVDGLEYTFDFSGVTLNPAA